MGAKPGSLGTVRGTIKNPAALAGIFADHAIRLVGNGTTGANKDGFHLRNVNVVRDLTRVSAIGCHNVLAVKLGIGECVETTRDLANIESAPRDMGWTARTGHRDALHQLAGWCAPQREVAVEGWAVHAS